jgi:CO/xanthine dehydrogenase FAD-binding subunit
MYEPRWHAPTSEDELRSVLEEEGARARMIAGGTDLTSQIRRGEARPDALVDLGRVEGLSSIGLQGSRLAIGATATHADVAQHPVIRERAAVLARACGTVGSPQIRARGTIGGNVANASPAADSAAALLALGATVELCSKAAGGASVRRMPLADFLLGPGRTATGVGEYVRSLAFDVPSPGARGTYLKLGQRNALAIAIVSAAVVFLPEAGRVAIALGSVAPTAVRAADAEAFFAREWSGSSDRQALVEETARLAVASSACIDDLRAGAAYRTRIVEVLVRRALAELVL